MSNEKVWFFCYVVTMAMQNTLNLWFTTGSRFRFTLLYILQYRYIFERFVMYIPGYLYLSVYYLYLRCIISLDNLRTVVYRMYISFTYIFDPCLYILYIIFVCILVSIITVYCFPFILLCTLNNMFYWKQVLDLSVKSHAVGYNTPGVHLNTLYMSQSQAWDWELLV